MAGRGGVAHHRSPPRRPGDLLAFVAQQQLLVRRQLAGGADVAQLGRVEVELLGRLREIDAAMGMWTAELLLGEGLRVRHLLVDGGDSD